MFSGKVRQTDVIRQIESLSGLNLCLKIFQEDVWKGTSLENLPLGFYLHQTAFCREVKITSMQRCAECDVGRIPQVALQQVQPFVHRCHAGASEVIIPLVLSQRLCAIGYLGQFRVGDDQPQHLPFFADEQVKQALVAGTLLQRYFLCEVDSGLSNVAQASNRYRQIVQFLRHNLANEPTLADLAVELSVSVSRAGHIVKEETGETFTALKTRLRLQKARDLMRGTPMTIEHIARAVGLGDVRYFHRLFIQETGQTPGQWRKEHLMQDRLQYQSVVDETDG